MAARAVHRADRSTLTLAFESVQRADRHEGVARGQILPEESGASVVLVGRVVGDAAMWPDGGASLRVDAEWIGRARAAASTTDAASNPVSGGVLLTVAGRLAAERAGEWRAGRRVRVSAELRQPSRYLDPGVPDQAAILARRGIALTGSVKSAALVDVVSRCGLVAEASGAIRSYVRRSIADAVGRWSARSAGIVTAIVIGDRSGLDPAVERRLQEAGTYHVIAISGGNIAILTGLILLLFRIAGMLRSGAMLVAIVALTAYAAVVGGGASVNRATLMAVLYLIGRSLDLRATTLNALAVAAAALVVVDPLTIADPAFLLTCGATLAILVAVPALPAIAGPRWLMPVWSLCLASLAAEAMLLPIGAAFFSRVTLAGLALNLLAVPMMAVAQLAGMVVVAVSLVSPWLAAAAGAVAHLGAEGLVRSADFVTLVPAVAWRVPPPSPAALVLYYGALIAAWSLWRRRAQVWGSRERRAPAVVRHGATVAACAAALWIAVDPPTWLARPGDGRLHVTFLDVGQGDTALVRLPDGQALLVDAGGPGRGSFDIGDRIVGPVLRHFGVRRLSALALTHGDADHIGGAASVLEEFRPTDVWEGIPVPPFLPLAELGRAAARLRSRWTNVQAGDLFRFGDVRVVVHHPSLPDWERQDVRNDDSIVLEILWRDVSIVLTGDIGMDVEQTLVSRFAAAPLRVVKVPHHGSLTSSSEAFVRALAPSAAVVSVGRSNRFGHPAPAVLGRYESAGAAIFRTDRDGAVTVDSNGHSLEFTTHTGRRLSLVPKTDAPRKHESTKARKQDDQNTNTALR